MTYFVPSTSVTTVSGVQSARSMRSGFKRKPGPFRRVTLITAIRPWSPYCGPVLGPYVSIDRVTRDISPFGRPARSAAGPALVRTGRALRRRFARCGFRARPVLPPLPEPGAFASALQVHQVLQDLVRGGDHAGVRLEAALRHDQVR